MSKNVFWRTVICGFFATFIMTMISFVQGGIGLPVIDIGHILKESFNHVHTSEPYTMLWGNMAYYIGGILMALLWVAFLKKIIPGNWIIKGIAYGIIISIFSGLVISPLVGLSAGDSFGVFYTDTWVPGKVLLAGVIMHIGFGLSLTLGLKVADVE
ncbi:MAG: hypothetical protein R3283_06900 [Balneolaceae bacterium]|nr:hypothetical protein [Balneolaceae bacterium]